MIKAHSSEKMLSSGMSDVVIALVYSEKTRLKKLMMKVMMMMVIIVVNKLQETTVFSSHQKVTSAMKLRSEK